MDGVVTRWIRYSGRAVARMVSTAVGTPDGYAKTVSGTVLLESFGASVHRTDACPFTPVVTGAGEVKPLAFDGACLNTTVMPESVFPAMSRTPTTSGSGSTCWERPTWPLPLMIRMVAAVPPTVVAVAVKVTDPTPDTAAVTVWAPTVEPNFQVAESRPSALVIPAPAVCVRLPPPVAIVHVTRAPTTALLFWSDRKSTRLNSSH